jgi:hypothetical protein
MDYVCEGYEQLDMFGYKRSGHIVLIDKISTKELLKCLREKSKNV